MTAYQEIEGMLDRIRDRSSDPVIERMADQISVLCRGYMEPAELLEVPDGVVEHLTPSERKMFNLLVAKQGQVVSKTAFMDVMYHKLDSEPEMKLVDVKLCHIRKKLLGTPYEDRIETVWGVGYRLSADRLPAVKRDKRSTTRYMRGTIADAYHRLKVA